MRPTRSDSSFGYVTTFLCLLIDCRNLATQLWSRWFAKPADPHEFTLSQEGTSILPEDIDLSIYAPDTSASAYGDPMATLDMTSYPTYMETNDYYGMNQVEPVGPLNSFMDGGSGYPTQDQQHPVQQQEQEPQQQMLMDPIAVSATNWAPQQVHAAEVTPAAVDACSVSLPQQPLATMTAATGAPLQTSTAAGAEEDMKASDNSTIGGLPVLKIKVTKGGQPYVVNAEVVSEENAPKATAAVASATAASTESVKENKSSSKDKVKDKKKDKERDKSDSKKSTSSHSSSSSKSRDDKRSSSDAKKKDRDRSSSRSSSSKDGHKSSSSSSSKDKSSKTKSSSSKDGEKAKVKSPSKEEKQAEKNRETLAVIKAMTAVPAVKMAKIPRKPKVEGEAAGEGASATASSSSAAAAAEALDKLTQQRPKTVKTFNSKFRSTGLVEELPPAAAGKGPAAAKKLGGVTPTGSALPSEKRSPGVKRAGSTEGLPIEKKLKTVDDSAISAAVAAVMKKAAAAADAKPAVKLISPRPRRKISLSHLPSCTLFVTRFIHSFEGACH